MFKKTFLQCALLLCAGFIVDQAVAADVSMGFASAEHMMAGDTVALKFSAKSAKKHYKLHLPNGERLTYGELIAMGDFYGIVDHPISEGQTAKIREQLFSDAVSMFAMRADNTVELEKIVKLIRHEEAVLKTGVKDGKRPQDVYQEMASDNARAANCITGGGCGEMWWLNKGRYLKLAERNYDHFREHALRAYRTGHELAMRIAAVAKKMDDPEQLENAYVINGFACHYLSDRFAAGHIRTPREALQEHVTPGLVGSVLAAYMHYEDGPVGVHVHNNRGDKWVMYGDAFYLSKQNVENKKFLHEALQQSADEVYQAYATGEIAQNSQVENIIPYADQVNDQPGPDTAPLFYWDAKAGKLFRRENLNDYYNHEWTTWWWGWSTLSELSAERGLPTHVQGMFAQSQYADKALAAGIITDKSVVHYIKSLHKK